MDRQYPGKPLVGVGAIIVRGEEVLLVQRGKAPSFGKWSIPGGLVELGESLEDAVRREVLEEVCIDVSVTDLVVALDRVIPDAGGKIEYHYILLDFLCEYRGGEPAPASDALACAFVRVADLERYDMTRGTVEAIRRTLEYKENPSRRVYDPLL